MPFAGIFELYGAYTDGIYSATKLNKIQILYNFSQLKVANICTGSKKGFTNRYDEADRRMRCLRSKQIHKILIIRTF